MSAENAIEGLDTPRGERSHELPSTGLLSFYDRLRERIVDFVEERGGKLGEGAAEALMLVPDVFMLLARLALDREVPGSTRAVVASALAYFVLPTDLLPELFVGPGGYVDDLVLAATVLSYAFRPGLEPYVEKYWSGPGKVRDVLRDVSQSATALLGESLYGRVKKLLARQGIEVEEPEATGERRTRDDENVSGEPV